MSACYSEVGEQTPVGLRQTLQRLCLRKCLMQGNMAVGTHPLFKLAEFIETIDRRHHLHTLVIQQQRSMSQHHRTRAALTLAPALGCSDHLAPFKIDVETPVTECACHLPQ
ncbi:tRNA A37 threonylcarbamoyladenosine synthetase subunit TsaC/SUA5/YrdC [Pseudomonas syringae pv. actinidiae]|uniref:tRNA A37 threonylcarbamoyladenosine synthetase subunit TsaC/SUA5/YrdC n=1 Tax=Pseudomonas syringae pv. actinidiae TaxID=103796 RepID=A0AAN4Q0W7_PSESF|nr:tRNA A37 threonylcarbamoyladenosine synthetase subunit TsaC/SUA5/YrdC [Pseudomonas syringae pv. actinidiae]